MPAREAPQSEINKVRGAHPLDHKEQPVRGEYQPAQACRHCPSARLVTPVVFLKCLLEKCHLLLGRQHSRRGIRRYGRSGTCSRRGTWNFSGLFFFRRQTIGLRVIDHRVAILAPISTGVTRALPLYVAVRAMPNALKIKSRRSPEDSPPESLYCIDV